jgi:tetratricopeptide (TPR) repeat protein
MVLTLALTAAVYSSSFSNGFLSWDDPVNVTGNTAIRSFTPAHLRAFFTQPLLGVYSPLVYLSYALDYRLGDLKPGMYHATNLALHLVCVSFVFAITRRLTGRAWAALLMAALFAVHPANVAAVTPISVRSSLLYAAFYLGAYLSYLSYPSYLSYRSYLLTFILFLCAALSKPAAVVFPVLMLLTDVYRDRQLSRQVWLEKVPFVLASIVIGGLALTFRTDMATGSPLETSLLERVSLAAYQLGFYAVHAVFPLSLSTYYPYPERTGGALPAATWLAPIVLVIAGWLIIRARQHRWLAFGVLFFVLHLALVLKLVPLGAEFTADRYLYLPLAGVCVLAVEFGARLSLRAQRALTLLALVLAAVWSVQSWRYSTAWRDDMTFYSRIIDRYPQAAVAYANRAATRLQLSDIDGAWRDSSEAIRLDSTNVQGFFNRATAEVLQGRVRDALADADRAIALDPRQPASFALRAQIRLSMQDFAGARDDAGKAIELAPDADDVFKPLAARGMARAMLGDGPGALTDLDRAIAVHPQEPALFFNRGQVRLALNDIAGGCADLRVAVAGGRDDAAQLARQRCAGR